MKLHHYQETAVAHLRDHNRAGLFLDMGLGKTAVTLSALEPRHLPVLVVAPKRVAENVWPTEQELWRPDLSLALAAGSPTRRRDALAQQADITVIGRDNIADVDPKAGYQTLVLDELSGFKSRSSKRWKAAKKIADNTPHIWGLTGTPSPNGLLDLWSQMYLLDQGARLGGTLGGYRNRYFLPGRQLASGVIIEWLLRPGADRRIHRLIDDICLSMSTDGRIDLPPTTYNEVQVTLPPRVKTSYERMKADLVLDLDVLGTVHTAANAAVLSNKLSQISAGFIYEDDDTSRYDLLHKEKINAVQEIVEGTGSPVLVFYRFRVEKELLQQAMPDARTADEPGVIAEWNKGKVPVMLAHPASAGHGLNLQAGGHTCVWTTLPWSLEEWEQANKRLARQGQQHPVVIHVLTAKGTIDRSIWRALHDKKRVQDALLDHLEEK